MKTFRPHYRAIIEGRLKGFVRNGDDVACIGFYAHAYGQCEMCDHTPIKRHFVLENLTTHKSLIVGRECVENYQVILKEWGYNPAFLVFPELLRHSAKWVTQNNPDALVFDNAVLFFCQVDFEAILHAKCQPSRLEKCLYAKHAGPGEAGPLVWVNEKGQQWVIHEPDDDYDQYLKDTAEFSEDCWDLCNCGDQPVFCEVCDNEYCPQCARGCTCEAASD